MNNLEKSLYNKVYTDVAKELDLPVSVVKGAYEGYWLFAKEHIKSLPLKDPDLTEEEFLQLRVGVNFPSLGKLAYPLNKFRAIKLRNTYIKHINRDEEVEYQND